MIFYQLQDKRFKENVYITKNFKKAWNLSALSKLQVVKIVSLKAAGYKKMDFHGCYYKIK